MELISRYLWQVCLNEGSEYKHIIAVSSQKPLMNLRTFSGKQLSQIFLRFFQWIMLEVATRKFEIRTSLKLR